jgi:hypothetical protein
VFVPFDRKVVRIFSIAFRTHRGGSKDIN